MFEDSLLESRALPLSSRRWGTAVTSISMQLGFAAAILTLPLLHREALPFRSDSPKALLPLPPRPPAPVIKQEHVAPASPTAALPIASRSPILALLLPSRMIAANDAPSLVPIGNGMKNSYGLPAELGGIANSVGPRVTVTPARSPAGPISISSGVSQGLLLTPIRPVYPAIARAAHIAGSVVVEATISPTGAIESLRVLSGPPMLQRAALEAIRVAHYQPYRLNGRPIAVQTTITVNFRMEG